MNFTEELEEFDPGFRLIAEETIEDLNDHHARAHPDYETWKRGLMAWLHYEGKDPERLRGYAGETLRATNYKIDQVMRWLWNERGLHSRICFELSLFAKRKPSAESTNRIQFTSSPSNIYTWF